VIFSALPGVADAGWHCQTCVALLTAKGSLAMGTSFPQEEEHARPERSVPDSAWLAAPRRRRGGSSERPARMVGLIKGRAPSAWVISRLANSWAFSPTRIHRGVRRTSDGQPPAGFWRPGTAGRTRRTFDCLVTLEDIRRALAASPSRDARSSAVLKWTSVHTRNTPRRTNRPRPALQLLNRAGTCRARKDVLKT